ncbi:MAG TPA: phosphotransferase [Gemmatimonadaceae bacterium]|nr:phosphotransferase [Gemmatimonadaceae bacterium]
MALTAELFLEMLAKRLPECREGLVIREGRPVDVQYTPGVGAQVLWKIKAADPETGRTARQSVFVRALTIGEPPPQEPADLIARYAELRASGKMRSTMPLKTPWFVVPEAHIVVHAFPLDPALPALLTVASPNAMKVALQQLWQTRHVRVRRVHVDTLSYTPGARAAMHYEVLAEDRETALPEVRRIVGKTDVRRSPARLFAGHWAVWRKSYGKVSVAPPVGYLAVARLSLQEFLTGTRLSDLTGRGELVGRTRHAARSIARIHELNLPVLKHRSIEKEMTGVERWIQVLSRIRPPQAPRLAKLSDTLRSELADRMRITATVHADFHLANILEERRNVTLIDWDQVAHGDPMLDVGRLLASLRVTALRLEGRLDALADVEEAFLDAYLGTTGEDERRARLFEAVSLITAAATPFRLQRDGWEEWADAMIDEVERMLELSRRGERISGTPHDLRREIPFDKRAEWARDRVYAQAMLVPLVHQSCGDDIEITQCIPEVKQNRPSLLRVRWTLKGYRGELRWKQRVEGLSFHDSSGRNKIHRLALAHEAASADANSVKLARPFGRIGPLSCVVVELIEGKRLDTDEVTEVDRLASALAAFHTLDIPLTKERETRRIVRRVARRVRALRNVKNELASEAHEVLESVQSAFEVLPEQRGPTIVPIGIRRIRISDSTVGVAGIHDVVLGDPLSNAAALIVELSLRAIDGRSDAEAADRFRESYIASANAPETALAAWEALASLRLACTAASTGSHQHIARTLIDNSRTCIDGVTAAQSASLASIDSTGNGRPGQ